MISGNDGIFRWVTEEKYQYIGENVSFPKMEIIKVIMVDITLRLVPIQYTVELQWLKHLWDHENMFELGLVRADEC